MSDRTEKLFDSFIKIEESYKVNSLVKNHIQYWPLLKNLVFFHDRKTANRIKNDFLKHPVQNIRLIKEKVLKRISQVTIKRSTKKQGDFIASEDVKQTNILFFGAHSHRNILGNESYNKYFDPVMDEIEKYYNVKLYEYTGENTNTPYYKKERLRFVNEAEVVKQTESKLNIEFDNDELQLLDMLAELVNISTKKLIRDLNQAIFTTVQWRNHFSKLLDKTKPSAVFCLCYYSYPMYGLVNAANEKNIPTIDMQHGSLGERHPSYSFNPKWPINFNILPKYFWVWDNNAELHLSKWVQGGSHKVVCFGHPWIKFLKSNKEPRLLEQKKKIILFTLTLGSIDVMLPKYLLLGIQLTSNEFIWYLRFHPRTLEIDKRLIEETINNLKLKNVDFRKANNNALPLILGECWAHISQSSGSLSEAALMGVQRNIVTTIGGREYFKHLIDEGSLSYYDPEKSGNLFNFLMAINHEKKTYNNNLTLYNYKTLLDVFS